MGLFPANSIGDDIELYTDSTREEVLTVVHTLRQQTIKRSGISNTALADYIAPKGIGKADYMGMFAVTSGHGVAELVDKYDRDSDVYNSILVKSVADRLAEAYAECMHELVRKEYWAYAPDEDLSAEELIREKYRGIRPAAGYPSCPDHTEKQIIFDKLQVEERIGIKLTESYAMLPAASVSGFYFSHPDAKYYGLGRISKDQITDYAARKGFTVEETEKWLSPNLNYTP